MHCFLNPPRGLGEFSQDKLLPGSQLPSPSTALLRNWDRPLEDRVGPAANTPGPRTSPPNDATARDYISGVLTAQEGFPGGRDSGLGKPHKQRCGVWNLESDRSAPGGAAAQGPWGSHPPTASSKAAMKSSCSYALLEPGQQLPPSWPASSSGSREPSCPLAGWPGGGLLGGSMAPRTDRVAEERLASAWPCCVTWLRQVTSLSLGPSRPRVTVRV